MIKKFTLNQEKFNSLISEFIAKYEFDENIDEEEKKDDDNDKDEKQIKATKSRKKHERKR